LRTIGPVGLLVEEHIESLHHTENVLNVRFAAIGNFGKRETLKNQAASIRNRPEVIKTLHEFEARRRRKLTNGFTPNKNPKGTDVVYTKATIIINNQPTEAKQCSVTSAKTDAEEQKRNMKKQKQQQEEKLAEKRLPEKPKTQQPTNAEKGIMQSSEKPKKRPRYHADSFGEIARDAIKKRHFSQPGGTNVSI